MGFDIGFMELLVIGVVALIVIGPKDLPNMFRTVGRYVGKAKGMAREFQRSMEDAADASGLKEATKGFDDLKDLHSMTKPGKAGMDAAKKRFNDIVEAKESGVPMESEHDPEADEDLMAADFMDDDIPETPAEPKQKS